MKREEQRSNKNNLMDIPNQIYSLITSDDLKMRLEKINANYSNLKQEGLIRNAILELYNEKYADEQYRAFAEHPRVEKNNGEDKRKSNNRVDLSITNLKSLNDKEEPKTYNIELKYHFPKHRKNFSDYKRSIVSEFKDRKSDMFILIVADWNPKEKKEFDNKWNIKTNLSKYLSNDNNWEQNLQDCFNKAICELTDYKSDLMEIVKIQVKEPYLTKYHFYILKKSNR